MDKCTHDVRANYWKEIIHNCQQRPAGQSTRQWLEENGILEQSYYYWQRKFRKVAYDQIDISELPSIQKKENEVSFAEITVSTTQKSPTDHTLEVTKPAAVIKTATLTIAISNEISESILSMILREVSHA